MTNHEKVAHHFKRFIGEASGLVKVEAIGESVRLYFRDEASLKQFSTESVTIGEDLIVPELYVSNE